MLTTPQIVPLLFTAMAIGLIGLILVTLAKDYAKQLPGTTEWGVGLLLIAGCVIGLLCARHILSDIPKALIGQSLVLLGLMFFAQGLRRFLAQPLNRMLTLSGVFFAIFILSALWFSFVQPSFKMRSIIFMLGGSIVITDMLLLIYKNRNQSAGIRLLGVALLTLLGSRIAKLHVELTNADLLHFPPESLTTTLTLALMPGLVIIVATVTFVLMGSDRLLQKLNQITRHDDLTQALNKRSFYLEISHEIERSIRYKRALSVMMLDLDNFKRVNDTLGHQQGDRILQEVVAQIRLSVRSADLIARFGGTAFAILLTELDVEHSPLIATRIQHNLKQTLPDYCGTNIGISSLRSPGETVDSLLHRADLALYKAKQTGKNQFAVV